MKQAKKVLFAKRYLLAAVILLLFACACGAKTVDSDPEELSVKAPPFGGYICGYENTETLVQVPIFLPVGYELTDNEICRITLSGEGGRAFHTGREPVRSNAEQG